MGYIFLFLFIFIFGIVGIIEIIHFLPQVITQTGGNVFVAIGLILLTFILTLACSAFMGWMMSRNESKDSKKMFFWLGFVMFSFTFLAIPGVFLLAQEVNMKFARQNISFVGKITNDNGDWINNRLVLVYLKNSEVGRAVSITGKPKFNDVVTDGYFNVKTPNIYEINAMELLNEKASLNITHNLQSMYISLGENKEGFAESFSLPSRKLTYVVKILAGDISSLPPEMLQPGSTRLRDDGQIIVALPGYVSANGTQTSGIFVQDISYAIKTEQVETNKLTVPINNCAGSVEVSQKYTQTQTFVHQYTGEIGFNIGVEIPLPLWAKLTPEFTAKYGFENGQVDTRTVEYNMAAAPGTNVIYIVTWSEVWESGAANVINGNDTIVVPFRVKTNLIYDIASEPRNCP